MAQYNRTGFLHAEGKTMVDGAGNEILLRGAALGNWMLLEGYMWGIMTSKCNREWLIEQAFRQLAGPRQAADFFPAYRKAFVREGDIRRMAELGFNSVRVPFNWRHLMEEGEGVHFKQEGFELLDQVIAWCRKYGLYAILDMHAAPGGQTGSNIDDGVDDVPRLFLDGENWEKALALWEKIAERYRDETAVGGYDLLNEPLRPFRESAPIQDLDYLIPALIRFYDDCVARIRKVDPHHMFSIEGAHWGRDTTIFDHRYDPNMCVHFHAYWTMPHQALLEKYLELSEKFQVPLWLGESGENTYEWYTTLFPLLEEYHISWNFWEWKKAIRRNSNYVIRQPEGWDQAVQFILGGPHPGYAAAKRMLREWLENCQIDSCEEVPQVTHALLRKPGIEIPALAYRADQHSVSPCPERAFRNGDGMRYLPRFGAMPEIDKSHAHGNTDVRDDHPWNQYDLLLEKGEYAAYTLRPEGKKTLLTLTARGLRDTSAIVCRAGAYSARITVSRALTAQTQQPIPLPPLSGDLVLTVECVDGAIALEKILFTEEKPEERPE